MPSLFPVLPTAERLPILYRVVDHDPPLRVDFLSDEERGAPPAAHETRWHRQGLSVFDKIGLAKWRLRKGFVSKTFIAAVPIEDGAPIYAKPGPCECRDKSRPVNAVKSG